MPRTLFYIWLLLTLAWVLVVGYYAYQTWPHLPLDISHTDPATRAAFNSAIMFHTARYAVVALLPPAILLLAARLLSTSRK